MEEILPYLNVFPVTETETDTADSSLPENEGITDHTADEQETEAQEPTEAPYSADEEYIPEGGNLDIPNRVPGTEAQEETGESGETQSEPAQGASETDSSDTTEEESQQESSAADG